MNTTPALYDNCAYTLVSEQEIAAICDRLAAEITETYRDSDRRLVMVVILKGSMPFAADLMKRLTLPLELEFMKVSSYGAGTKTSGEIKVSLDLNRDDLQDIDLLVVEDIVDSGRTLSRLTQLLKNRNAHSVRTCIIVSQKSTPGSADFHALWIILSQSLLASISLRCVGLSDAMGYCCT